MLKVSKIIQITLVVLVGLLLVSPAITKADTQATKDLKQACRQAPGSTFCTETTPSEDPVANILVDVINLLLFAVGALAVIMIIFAGFRYLKSNGDSNKVSEAKNTLLYAIVGLVVALLANRIIVFFINRLID